MAVSWRVIRDRNIYSQVSMLLFIQSLKYCQLFTFGFLFVCIGIVSSSHYVIGGLL